MKIMTSCDVRLLMIDPRALLILRKNAWLSAGQEHLQMAPVCKGKLT